MKYSERIISFFQFMRNKFIVTLIIFLGWLLLFDEYNLISRIRNKQTISELERQKENHILEIERSKRLLKGLQGDNDNLETFAREQYLMKKDNEDIYIVFEK